MSRRRKWTVEDNVVALYLAMYDDQGLKYTANEVEKIISTTLSLKKGFKMRVQNYHSVVPKGKKELHAGYPNGYPPYKALYQIFKSFGQDKFRDYVNMILETRKEMENVLE